MNASVIRFPRRTRAERSALEKRIAASETREAADFFHRRCLQLEGTLRAFITRATEAELMVERLRIALAIANRANHNISR